MSSVNRDLKKKCLPFQSVCFCFLFLAFAVARTTNNVLCKSGEDGHDCAVSDRTGKTLSFTLYVMLTIGFFVDALYEVEEVPFCS